MKATAEATLDVARIVQTHHRMLWRYLRLLGCENALAEDLVQDTFLYVLRRSFVDTDERSTAAYLRRVAKHAFIDEMRRRKRAIVEDLDQADEIWSEVDHGDGGETWQDALRECMEQLSGRAEEVLRLRFGDHLRLQDVARQMGMQESGVKTLLSRVKQRLRLCVTRKVESS